MKKQFKNDFGISCDNQHLMKAFINEALSAGWQWQISHAETKGLTNIAYFSAGSESGHTLFSGHGWYCKGYGGCKSFVLPQQWDEAIAYMKEEVREVYNLGDRFECIKEVFKGDEYLLANPTAGKICLINLKTGGRWTEPVDVKSTMEIEKSEFIKCLGTADNSYFVKIKNND